MPNRGKYIRTPEIKKKLSNTYTEKYKNGYVNPMTGKKRPDLVEYNKKFKSEQMEGFNNPMKKPEVAIKHKVPNLKKGHKGNKNPAWQGGISFGEYGIEFNEALKKKIRERDNSMCQICGKSQEKNNLDVHHIDYNKKNNSECNLIALCHSCHTKTCFKRKEWINFFSKKRIELLQNKHGEITIHISTKDRHSELALLLQSLRTQTYQKFSILVLDDASGTPVITANFIVSILNRMKLENHKVKLLRNEKSFGCCPARNKCIEEDDFGNPLTLRLDDDVILEPDYIKKLIEGIDAGYDLVTGVVPLLSTPEVKRENKFISPIINEHKLNDKGELIMNKDECGFCYLGDQLIPTHQFRTNALYKSEIHKVAKYPIDLTTVAFREEGFFSFMAIIGEYKLAVHTGAVCWHLQTQSGGNRRPDYQQCVQIDEATWRKWIKKQFDKHGDFLTKYNQEVLNEN